MGHTLNVKLRWKPIGYAKILSTNFDVSVGGLPTEIRVTKLPDKMDYKDGDTFNPTGIIVHAYYEDGSDYGTVLNNELTYKPMEITIGSESGSSSEYTDGHGINAMALTFRTITGRIQYSVTQYRDFTQHIANNRPIGRYYRDGKDCYMGLIYTDTVVGAVVYLTRYNGKVYMCRNSLTSTNRYAAYGDYGKTDMYGTHYYDEVMNTNDTINLGTFAYSSIISSEEYGIYVPESTVDPTGVDYNTLHPVGTEITVQWNRPVDGATLTCPLTLNVEPSPDPPGPVVPEKVVGGDDVAIPAQAHSGDKTITGANYPEAQSVGDDAFNGCSNLKTVNISLATTIGDRAFANCGRLTSITDESITETT